MINKGDYVKTPRFFTIKIHEVFENRSDAFYEGFKESAHYDDGIYEILGKSIGHNRMIFAAVKKD